MGHRHHRDIELLLHRPRERLVNRDKRHPRRLGHGLVGHAPAGDVDHLRLQRGANAEGTVIPGDQGRTARDVNGCELKVVRVIAGDGTRKDEFARTVDNESGIGDALFPPTRAERRF